MRKFLAILSALLSAFIVIVLYGAWRQGVPFRDLSPQTVRQILLGFRPSPADDGESKDPGAVAVSIVPEAEENLSFDERMSKGDYFSERGFLTFAANEYVKASNLDPARPEPYLKLAQTHFALGDYQKARLNNQTLLLLRPTDAEALYFSARVDLKEGRYDDARATLDALAERLPPDPRLLYDRALLQIIGNDYEGARKLLSEAAATPPTPDLLEKIDRLLAAYREFDFAQAAETLYLSELLSRAMSQNKEYELAIFKLKEVLKTRNDLRDAWILLGFSYLNLGEHYFALTAFQRAYELDPVWPTTPYFLGLTYQELQDFGQAILYFNQALANQFEPTAVVRQKLADLYLSTKDYARAADMYNALLAESPDDVNAFIRPIWLYLSELQQPAEALRLAELAMVTFPENPMGYNLLGWAQTGTGDYQKAEINLKKALELQPTLAAAHLNLGKLYELQNRMDEAIVAFEKAYTLDPNGSIGQLAAQKYNALVR